jgi:hypothetical protein
LTASSSIDVSKWYACRVRLADSLARIEATQATTSDRRTRGTGTCAQVGSTWVSSSER